MQKYEASLGIWGRVNVGKAAADKISWTFKEKEEIQRLQTYLDIHIGTINMMLAGEGLERMNLYESKAKENALEVRESLNSAHATIDVIRNGVKGQVDMLGTMNSLLGSLCGVVSGEIISTLQQLSQVVNIVW